MRKSKGKQKNFLYIKRKNEKILRNKTKRFKKGGVIRKNHKPYERNFLRNDYNKVVKYLDKKNFALSALQYRPGRQEFIYIPSIFSISDNTEEVIKILRRVYTVARSPVTKEIIFKHGNCSYLGLSASTIMDIIVLACQTDRKQTGNLLELSGEIPHDKYAKDVLLASGLPYHLKAISSMQFDEEHVERFETIAGKHSVIANRADATATRLTEYFNKCLRTQNMELNAEGMRLFSRILGEVISNCEIHGGEGSTWYTQGHYQITPDNSYGEMQLLFLNIGETIYEGLKNDSSVETKQKIQYIVGRHEKYFTKNWTEEMVCTVFALQEGISRLRDKNVEGYEGRGTGTVSMLEMFYDIGESETGLKPHMTIISGNTKICFTDQYQMESKQFMDDIIFGDGTRQIVAFNDGNDIYKPANPDHVKRISEYFPGTVISLRFYLDNRYISSKKEKRRRRANGKRI